MTAMERFVTFEDPNNGLEIAAMTEPEFHAGGQAARDRVGAHEYVWQFAPDRETAIRNHVARHDEWSADVRAGRPEKHTYGEDYK